MKIIVLGICMCFVIPVQPDDMERHADCESCLTAAREIELAMKEAPAENRQAVMENLISGTVCEKMLPSKLVSKDKITSSCMRMLETHYDQFHAALVNKEPTSLDIVLCYEQSTACVGVKRTSFEDKKGTFTERDIEALLKANKDKMRVARPIHSGVPVHSDEL